ncbi:hypothetical protein MHU86_11673 [Fragilaria crotonensis]|nr:hypothetical protein MHU86_11673 [Fragilaria crotonensis]
MFSTVTGTITRTGTVADTGLIVAVTWVGSGSGHVRYLNQFYLTHANELMDWSELLPYTLGRRLQNDSGKGDDGMYFCIGEDGTPVAMGQNGGGRRTLRRLTDASPPYCNDLPGGYPGNFGNSQYPFPPPNYPVASPAAIGGDAPTLESRCNSLGYPSALIGQNSTMIPLKGRLWHWASALAASLAKQLLPHPKVSFYPRACCSGFGMAN